MSESRGVSSSNEQKEGIMCSGSAKGCESRGVEEILSTVIKQHKLQDGVVDDIYVEEAKAELTKAILEAEHFPKESNVMARLYEEGQHSDRELVVLENGKNQMLSEAKASIKKTMEGK